MWTLFLIFFKIGMFTFGGGYAMIAQIKEEIVEKKQWLTEEELTEVIAIAECTPGPIAINLATFVGYKKKGVCGSIVATLGVVLPSMILIFIISLLLQSFMQNKYVQYAFVGIKCAVAFLILKAGVELFLNMKKTVFSVTAFILVFALTILFDLLSVSFSSILFILIGGAIGALLYALSKAKERRK